jgi:L-ascorbate metabolism protein UlaG (beta-lactamase superfamily)
MKIKYLGHSAFELTLKDGKKVVFDPYQAGAFGTLKYGPIKGDFNIAVVSHDHDDHACKGVLSRSKKIVDKAGKYNIEGVSIESWGAFHDESRGSKRGKNLVSVLEADGLRIAHLGDLGHHITAKDFPALKGVDVLMIPVGGYFTIDAKTAAAVVGALEPKLVIPMHFKAAKVDFPITPVENFTRLMDNVEKAGASEIEVKREDLPSKTKVIVLDPAN